MLGRNFGFVAVVKTDAPHITLRRVLQRHALATKTLPQKLAEVLKIVLKCVNYVQNSTMNHIIFKKLCNEIRREFEVLIYYSTFTDYPRDNPESCFCLKCRINPVFARALTLSCRLLRKF